MLYKKYVRYGLGPFAVRSDPYQFGFKWSRYSRRVTLADVLKAYGYYSGRPKRNAAGNRALVVKGFTDARRY